MTHLKSPDNKTELKMSWRNFMPSTHSPPQQLISAFKHQNVTFFWKNFSD